MRPSKESWASNDELIFDPVVIHRHVDYYYRQGDEYGDRGSDQLLFMKGYTGGELMLQRRLEPELWGQVKTHKASSIIAELKKKGITHAPNGMILEDFFVEKAGPSTLPKTLPGFGDEIPLGSLSDKAPSGLYVFGPGEVGQ
jgi:hypothetical protein